MKKFDVKGIKEFFQTLADKKGDEYARNPQKNWIVMVTIGTFLFFVIVFIHYQIFLQINDESTQALNFLGDGGTQKNVNTDTLNDILKIYKEKENMFEELKSNKPNIVDPSL